MSGKLDYCADTDAKWALTAPRDKIQALEEIARTIKIKRCLTEQDAIFLLLRELMKVN
ncbi:MAG: hypothetical protein ONB05_09895 [candidate division KSB1 bacterium]|nr:hypothetical protein [candidate division KSB1 bacterium]